MEVYNKNGELLGWIPDRARDVEAVSLVERMEVILPWEALPESVKVLSLKVERWRDSQGNLRGVVVTDKTAEELIQYNGFIEKKK